MSERFATEIRIGGAIDGSLAQELCDAIVVESLPLDWGEASFAPESPADLMANLRLIERALVLRLCDEQARWGQFPELEAFLVDREIPFDRHTEGGCGYDPERVSFRPGSEPMIFATTIDGKPIVSRDVVDAALIQLQSAQAAIAQERFQYLEVTPTFPSRRGSAAPETASVSI